MLHGQPQGTCERAMGENRISEGMICAFGVGKDTCQVIYCNNIDCDGYGLRMISMILMMMMKMRRPHTTIKELYTHMTRVTAEGQ